MVFGAALEIVEPEGVPPDSLRDINWHQRYSTADKLERHSAEVRSPPVRRA